MELTQNNKKITNPNNPTLPDDLILSEIITRIPLKSLIRFNCVSKPWRATISNPDFRRLYAQRQPQNPGVFVQTDSSVFTVPDYESYDPGVIKLKKLNWDFPKSVIPPESSNGLVCIFPDYENMCVLNPVTGERRDIPLPKNVYVDHIARHSRSLWGFGYISSLDDYKFVNVGDSMTHVFELRGGNWRICETSGLIKLYSHTHSYSGSGIVLANGISHWMLRKFSGNRCTAAKILAFDLAAEAFNEVQLPECIANGAHNARILRANACIGVIKDDLCIASQGSNQRLQVWVLERYGDWNSWTKVLNLSNMITPAADKIRFFTSYGIGQNCKILMHLNGQVYVFYWGDNQEHKCGLIEYHTLHMRRYVETIESPFM